MAAFRANSNSSYYTSGSIFFVKFSQCFEPLWIHLICKGGRFAGVNFFEDCYDALGFLAARSSVLESESTEFLPLTADHNLSGDDGYQRGMTGPLRSYESTLREERTLSVMTFKKARKL